MRAIWAGTSVEENNLSQNISTLRRLFGAGPPDSGYIVTIPGRGYRFVADVQPQPEPVTETVEAPPPVSRRRWPLLLALGAVLLAVLASLAVVSRRGRAAPSARPNDDASMRSIAVLPFKPLLPADRDKAMELGMADTLIARLSTIGGITVRPLNAVRRYDGLEQDARAAGRQLGVDAVLDGTIHRRGDRVRISARLLRVIDDRQLWEGRFDSSFVNIFDVQDSIAEKVATELAIELTREQRQRLLGRATLDPQAYELYLRGRFFSSLAQPDQAAEAFEAAVARDARFALAHAGLADIYSRMPVAIDAVPNEVIPKARASALRALALDGVLSEPHASLGWIQFYYDWDWAASEVSFRRALEINPSDFSARMGYAHLMSNTGRHEEALRSIQEAQRLDPISPLAQVLEAQFLFSAGRHAEAGARAARVLESTPSLWIAHLLQGFAQERSGDYTAALQSHAAASAVSRSRLPMAARAHALARAGRPAEARQSLAELHSIARRAHVPPTHFAAVYAGLGEKGEALRWLERGFAERDVRMVFLAMDPYWNDLRNEPRFQDLLARMNFPAAPAVRQSHPS